MEDKNKKIGSLLKEKRKELGYSLEDVKILLKKDFDIDLDNSNISRYENGTVKNMNAAFLRALCKVNKIDYIPIFRELGYVDPEDDRILKMSSKDKNQYDKTMDEATLFFNDENISEEDKQKLLLAMNEMFFMSKQINKEKYAKKSDKDKK